MNIKIKQLLKNLSVAFAANLVSLFGSALLTLILPKYIGVTQYAYYQLYIFYTSYVAFLGIGWVEGVYLRYGGEYFDNINKRVFSSQLKIFSLFETILSVIIFMVTLLNAFSIEKNVVYGSFCLCIVIYMPRALLHNLLQTTGRIKEYATGVIVGKLIHIVVTSLGLILGQSSFMWYVGSELFGRLCASIYIFWICRNIVFIKHQPMRGVLSEIKENISCGVALMISNIASMLIIGVIRQAIEFCWDVETFGKTSLTLSISSLLLTFINSMALVLFPMLKRNQEKKLARIYCKIRTGLMIPILAFLAFYYPVKVILSEWLPQYADSLNYMAILFPMCVVESKMTLLINTYMKALRKERSLLAINFVSLGLSGLFAFVACIVLHSLDMAILSIVLVLAFRCIIAELTLKRFIQIQVYKDIALELAMTTVFIIGSWSAGMNGVLIYLVAYIVYLFIKRKDLKELYHKVVVKQ